MKRLYQFSIAALLAFMVWQCTETNPNKPQPNDPPVVTQSDTVAPPEWFCSAIETYPLDADKKQRAVGGKNKFWATGRILKIGFLGGTASQIAAVKQYAPEWTQSANLKFDFPTVGPYDIRIAFNAANGAWSYVGTDNASVTNQTTPTMNLGWIGRDVICHEFGHAIGLFHEHQNPNGGICYNEANVIADLQGPPNNWTVAMIRFNVLDKLNPAEVLTTPWDKVSVMHYNIPARWTCNNTAIPGGTVISQTDKEFVRLRYPGVVPPTTDITLTSSQVDYIVSVLNARQTESDTNAARIRRGVADIKKVLKR